MKERLTYFWSFTLALATTALGQTVVINEIMYKPMSLNPAEEWIELYNPATTAVDLQGWHFSQGVAFAFSNLSLPAKGYLVVAANLAAFKARYPNVANVVGGWTNFLSNNGEDIVLADAQGRQIDRVRYATEGDWGVRRWSPVASAGYYGWEWYAEHDGGGKSLELINPALPHDEGQNWSASRIPGGTPGGPNTVASANAPPLVLAVQHIPAVPKSSDSITLLARIVDEQPSGLTARAWWRKGTNVFVAAPMFDDGAHNDGLTNDGIYAVILPPQTNLSIIEFYIQATDAQGRPRTWPAPALNNLGNPVQTVNALFQVDDSLYTGTQPVFRLVMTEVERIELENIMNSAANSDAARNATFISSDSTGTEVRYLASVRNRGAGTRGATPHNRRVEFANDRPWHGVVAVNLNGYYSHSQVAGCAIATHAGLATEQHRPVQFRVNGVNLAASGLRQYGSYVQQEARGNEFVQNHFPLDPDGNLYACISGNHQDNLTYLGTDPNRYIQTGYIKQNNASENDWSDLIHLTDVLNNTPDATYANAVRQVANVDEWMRYFAVFTLLLSRETSLATGAGDDYVLYRGQKDTRFVLLGHDWDTILNEGDTRGSWTDSIFRMVPAIMGATNYNLNTVVLNRFMMHPEFVPLYYKNLKQACDTTFAPEEINPLLDEVLGDWVPQATIKNMKDFAANRRAYVLSQIPLRLSITNTPGVVSGYPKTTTSTVRLGGAANAIDTRAVKVNGVPANWVAWRAAWNIPSLALNPGINRVLVQALDAQGQEIDRQTVDVWYDDGSVLNVGGTISGNPTWLAADGPFQIVNNMTIPAGSTLTIQSGTTVYLSAGVNLTVASGGSLRAEGTATAPIRFSSLPGTGANWGNITINGAAGSPETRIAYAHLEFNAANTATPCLQVSGGTVFFDHLTFGNTAAPYIHVDGASFVVQNCVFPSPTALFEPVHGTGGILSGGHGVFLRNFFGAPNGYNDVIDFTGGNRPGGPIVQFVENVFLGSGDDILDLDGTDAWVEGNIFLHAHKNGSPDTSSGVSGGDDSGNTSEVTIIGNVFYDCDQAAMAKQGNFFTLLNNTIVHQTHFGGQDTEGAVVCLADAGTVEGKGIYLDGNIIYDVEKLVRNLTAATVTFTNNLMPLAWNGPGGNNSTADPFFNYIPQISETYFTTWQQAQVMRQWLSLRPGSPGLGTGPNGSDKGAVNPRGVSISGEPPATNDQTTATLTVGINRGGSGIPSSGFPNGSGYVQYKWRLDAGAWSADTPIANPIVLSGLANGPHRVEVVGCNDAGTYQNDPLLDGAALVTTSRVWVVDTSYHPPATTPVRINEVLAWNVSTFTNALGATPDLVELYNYSASPANLAGMGLTDDPGLPRKFVFPAGTILGAGQFLVLYADNDGGPGLHLGFALNQGGDDLYLFNANGSLCDSVSFGQQLADYSIGQLTEGTWGLCQPTFGSANVAQPLGDPYKLRINEWLAGARSIYPGDFVELYNPGALPVALGGMFLTDNPRGWPDRHRIAVLSFLGAGACLAFLADGNTNGGPEHLSFRLATDQGEIALFAPDLERLDFVFYGQQSPDISEGRQPNGADTYAFFSPPTPGVLNADTSGMVVSTAVTPLVGITSQLWRYEISGRDLGTAWRAVSFPDESTWQQGYGLFGYESPASIYPYPFQTTIPAPSQGGPNVAYFRTHFQWLGASANVSLVSTNYIDDGIIYYLNGYEVGRIRVAADGRVSNTSAEGAMELLVFTNVHLVSGDNVLAARLFQGGTGSTDDAFGMGLAAVTSTTNYILRKVVLNEVMANNLSFPSPGDTNVTDWIELYNPGADAVSLAGMSLSDNFDNPTRWVFPAGVSLPGRGYLVVRCDPGSPASSNAAGILNTGFGLSAQGDKLHLFDRPENRGTLLDSLSFGLQAADWSIGRVPGGTGAWRLTLPTPGAVNLAANLGRATTLKINEWLASPSGNDNDYFELYNSEAQPVELSGLYLTDTLTKWNMHQIPPLSFIGVGEQGFARFVADGNAGRGANHVNFGLAAGGEAIGLFTSNGQGIDAVSFGPQQRGVSEGRFPDGSANITQFPGTPTPGESNLRRLKDIVVNEVLTHTDPPWEDAIELYNSSLSAIDLSGWWLTDQRTDPRKFRIPEGTLLPALGYVVFYEYQFNPRPGLYPSFALSGAKGDEVYLYAADSAGNLTGYRAGVRFGAAENGISLGRHETSVGVDFTALARPTFGVEAPASTNEFRAGAGAANSGPLLSPVVINEIMYHPPRRGTNVGGEFEFVELKNSSGQVVPLYDPQAPTNTWRLRDAVDFEFPSGVALPPGGWLLVVGFDPVQDAAALAEFRGYYGLSPAVVILGPFRGRLANGTENVELYKPDAPVPPGGPDAGYVPYVLADRVKYADQDPWPSAADGRGNTNSVGVSLQRRDPTQYGNDPVNWLAGIPSPGADSNPGFVELPRITRQPQDASDLVGATVSFSVLAQGAEPLTYQWRGNGADLPGATNAVLTLTNVQLEQSGSYAVRVVNAAGTALSAPANLLVRFPPRITQEPQDRAAALGGFARFMVVAEGAPPLAYHWRFNGQDLALETRATLLITNVQPENEGEYLVVIANSFGSVTSAPARLVLSAVPMMLSEPRSANAFVGSNVVFEVGVVGAEPLFYQWRFNNVDIPGATNAILVIAQAQFTNSGAYRVLVTNEVGAVLSEEALLVVSQPSVLSVTATEAAAAENGPTRGVFTINRTGNLAPELAVYFRVGGTAEVGGDFALPASPVVIAAGAVSTQIIVLPVDDALAESLETVVLTLADRPEYAIGSPSSATLTIADNDNRPPSVALTAPADGTRFPLGAKVQLSAAAGDADGSVASVEFYADGVKLGEASFEPFDLTWTNPGLGAHLLSAIAIDDLGARAVSAPVTISMYSLGFSDLFASRGVLTGYTNYVRGTNKTYTREPGEPYHTHNGNGKGTHSAWLTWSAPETGTVTMDTLGSSFDTVLVVYTNRPPTVQTVSNLVKVASNDDADGSTFQSRVSFAVVEGTDYQIAVDGFASTNYGTIVFHLGQPKLKPEITLGLTNQAASPGENISLTVGATGGGVLSYQWSFNGQRLPGETNATLPRPAVQHTQAGVYAVTVSNGSGTAISQAELTVRPVLAGVTWTPNVAALRILGTPGKPYTVLVTTNLVDWAEVGTVNSATVETLWLDQGALQAPARAYRLRWP